MFLKEKLMIDLVPYEMWKETPQFETIMRAKDSISKIKDISSLKVSQGDEGHLI